MVTFCNSIEACNLEDLGFKGYKFTWKNKQEGAKKIQERLDIRLANSLWINLFPRYSIEHRTKLQSDLCNTILKLITKYISNCIKTLFSHLISQAQSVFFLGRLIKDNALLSFELIHAMKHNYSLRQASFDLKLDMSKPSTDLNVTFSPKCSPVLASCLTLSTLSTDAFPPPHTLSFLMGSPHITSPHPTASGKVIISHLFFLFSVQRPFQFLSSKQKCEEPFMELEFLDPHLPGRFMINLFT